MKRITYFISVLLVCFAVLLLLTCPVQAKENAQPDLLSDKENGISLYVKFGYDNTVKYGRYTTVTGEVYNDGRKAFTGSFQCLTPKSKDNALYKGQVTVEPGRSKKVSLIIPIYDDTGYLQVKLFNKKNKQLIEHKYRLSFGNYDKSIYTGILTDNKEGLSYLDGLNLKPFFLSEDTLSDNFLGLDLLDVLIINDYDVSKLNKEKIDAIKEWVYLGGTLVLTAGKYDKELKEVFGTDFGISIGTGKEDGEITFLTQGNDLKVLKQYILDYQKGRRLFYQELTEKNQKIFSAGSSSNLAIDYKNIFTAYNEKEWSDEEVAALRSETAAKQIAPITLNNGISLVKEDKSELMLCSKQGNGKVELIAFDIGLEKNQTTLALSIIKQIAENISELKKNQLDNEYYGWYMSDGMINSIASGELKKVPATYKYVILIIIYLLLSGPAAYIFLKKKKIQGYGLLTVSVLAVLFAVIIFFTGMHTRITKPYAEYLRIKDYTRAGMDRIDLSLTMPNNYNYTVNLTKKFPIVEMSDTNPYTHNTSSPQTFVDYNNVKKVIRYEDNGVKLQVTDNTAFSPVFYQGNFKTAEKEGGLTTDLRHTGTGISGTIRNDFNYDISNAILLCDEYLIKIGELKKGQLITLKDNYGYYLSSFDDLFDNSLVESLTALPEKGRDHNENARLNQLIVTMIENNYSQGSFTDCLLGFKKADKPAEAGEGDEFLAQVNSLMQTRGTEIVKIPVTVDKKLNDRIFVSSIDPYIRLEGSNVGTYYTSRYMVNDSLLLSYQFPAEDKIKSFTMSKARNLKGNSKYTQNFNGTVYFLNVNTGKYEEVFTDNYDTEMDASEYLTENNTLTVRFRQEASIQNYQVILPHISYWKEAN